MLSTLWISAQAQQPESSGYKNFYDYQKAFYEKYKSEAETDKDAEEEEGEQHEEEFEHFKRFEKWNAPRLFPTSEWKNTYQAALNAELELKNQFRSSNGRWQACGPNNINNVTNLVDGIGRVNRVVIGQSGAIYAATDQAGLWKRVGSSWSCLTNFIPNLSVSGIAIDPLDENVIYIITGNSDGANGPALTSDGIYKTNDGGISWYRTGYQLPANSDWRGYKIVVNPNLGNVLMVASTAGILRTTDSGLTWDTVLVEPGFAFTDIEMKPNNSNYWYASTENFIYRTISNGASWSTPHATNAINADNKVTRTVIAVTPANPNVVYVLAGGTMPGSSGFVRLLKCSNAGTTFSFTTMSDFSNAPNILGWTHNGSDMDKSQAGYDLCIAASTTNENQIYTGGINVWYNGAGGASGSWSLGSYWVNDGSTTVDKMHADQHDLLMFNDDLYIGNDGGIFYQDRQAIDPNWDALYSGMNITQFYSLELDPTNPNGHTLLGAQDNGVKLYDGDDNFQTLLTGDGGEGCVDPTDNNRYYFYMNDNLYKDGCDLCWPGTDSPQPGCGCPDDVTDTPSWVGDRALEINPQNHSQLFSGYTCLFRTDNEGGNWSWQTSVPCAGGTIIDLDFDASNRLWVLKPGSVFRQNSNGSTSFTNVTSNLPVSTAFLTGLACSNTNSEVAFACFSGYADGTKVYYTNNGGATWSNTSGFLPNVPVNCIVYHPNSEEGVYVGTDIGVFYSDLNTLLWTPFRNGMPSVAVTDLEISTVDNMLYASTFGRGLWKTDLFNGCQNYIRILSGVLSSDGYVGSFQFTSGYNTYRAIDSIAVNMPLTAGLGQNVTMISEGYIRLAEGFEVKNNTDFRAFSDSYCFNTFSSYLKGEYAGEMVAPENQNSNPDTEEDIQLSVYPNPFVNELKLGIAIPDDETPLQIFFSDLTGRAIAVPYSLNSNGSVHGFRFDTSALSDGAYLITVRSGNNIQTKKVIKLSAE
ncbi:hypothetical protein LBMAG27_20310 [Bacteroidota bacterium]|nr:hypothetical protein LBMAG27_20310 [Bacteroidota bacterium]